MLEVRVHFARIYALEGCRGGALGWRVEPSASRPEMVWWVPSPPPPPEPESLFSGDYCPDVPSSPPPPDPRARVIAVLMLVGDFVFGIIVDRSFIDFQASSISMAASAGLLASEGEDALLLEARFVLRGTMVACLIACCSTHSALRLGSAWDCGSCGRQLILEIVGSLCPPLSSGL